MISVSKYNEVMEHIEVTEDMRERVLGNIAQKRRRQKIRQTVRIVSAAAACVVVVFGAAYILKNRTGIDTQPPAVTETSAAQTTALTTAGTTAAATTYTTAVQTAASTSTQWTDVAVIMPTECGSAEELRTKSGLPIYDVRSVPFKVTETHYENGNGVFAGITYWGEEEEMCSIRVSRDTTDQSGIGFVEETRIDKAIEVDGVPVTLTTDIEGGYLASWITDGRCCSVFLRGKNNAENILPIVSEILAQHSAGGQS